MRVFYIHDDEEDQINREYFIKIENISISEDMKTTKIISALNPVELKDKIMALYGFHDSFNKEIQLWSGPIGSIKRIRFDTMEQIPIEYDTVFVRGVLIKDTDNSI